MEKALETKPVEALPKSACLFLHKGVDNSTDARIVGSIPQRGIIGPYSTLVFQSDSLDTSFIDMKRSFFEARVKAVRADNGLPPEGIDFAPTNNLMHSLIQDVVVTMNGTQISSTAGKYPFLSMMYALLDSKESAETYRSLALYSKETPGYMDETRTQSLWVEVDTEDEAGLVKDLPGSNPLSASTSSSSNAPSRTRRAAGGRRTGSRRKAGQGSGQGSGTANQGSGTTTDQGSATTTTGLGSQDNPDSDTEQRTFSKMIGGTNSSMAWRHEKLSSGQEYTLIAKLDMDVFHMETYLVNGAALKITMKQTSPQFRVIQPDGEIFVDIVLVDMIFHPFFIHLSPELILATEEMFKSGKTALMPYTSHHLESYTVAPGKRSFRIVDAFSGLQPLSILICMVDSEAALGSRSLNPFILDHFNLASLEVRSNQELLYSVKMDFENNDFQNAYYDLFKNSLGNPSRRKPQISLEMFKKGFFLLMIELSEEIDMYREAEVWTKIKPGSVCISGTFQKPLDKSIEVIYLGFLYNSVMVTDKRAVYLASSRFRETKSAIV